MRLRGLAALAVRWAFCGKRLACCSASLRFAPLERRFRSRQYAVARAGIGLAFGLRRKENKLLHAAKELISSKDKAVR